jgi:hypothetical protein
MRMLIILPPHAMTNVAGRQYGMIGILAKADENCGHDCAGKFTGFFERPLHKLFRCAKVKAAGRAKTGMY